MADFSNRAAGLDSPPAYAFTITPDDTADLARPTRGLMIAGAGDVTVVMEGGDTVTLPGLLPGVQYAVRVRRVLATATTASGLVGLA